MKNPYKFTRLRNKGKNEISEWVDGIPATTHFAAREEKNGWRITHLPSGYVLLSIGFTTQEDAVEFCKWVEQSFGAYLDSPERGCIRDNADKVKGGKLLYWVMQKLDRSLQTVTMDTVKGLINGQTATDNSYTQQGTAVRSEAMHLGHPAE